jgi:hypothetical protein
MSSGDRPSIPSRRELGLGGASVHEPGTIDGVVAPCNNDGSVDEARHLPASRNDTPVVLMARWRPRNVPGLRAGHTNEARLKMSGAEQGTLMALLTKYRDAANSIDDALAAVEAMAAAFVETAPGPSQSAEWRKIGES